MAYGVSFGTGCGAVVAAPQLAALPLGQWRTVSLSLKCFAAAGPDMAKLDAPFRLSSRGSVKYSLSRVALGTVADETLACKH